MFNAILSNTVNFFVNIPQAVSSFIDRTVYSLKILAAFLVSFLVQMVLLPVSFLDSIVFTIENPILLGLVVGLACISIVETLVLFIIYSPLMALYAEKTSYRIQMDIMFKVFDFFKL